MIPIAVTEGAESGKQLERKLISLWQPRANGPAIRYDLMKDTYVRDIKHPKRVTDGRTPPWTREIDTMDYEGKGFTQYRINGLTRITFDLAKILETTEDGDMISIMVEPGYRDLTNWNYIRHMWAESNVTVVDKGEVTKCTMARLYVRQRKERHGFELRISAKRTRTTDIQEQLTQINERVTQLQEASEEDLAFYWRTRSEVAKTEQIKWRKAVWQEITRRYGAPAKPVHVSLPYVPMIAGTKLKKWLHTKLDEQPWPDYIKKWHKEQSRVTTQGAHTIEDRLCTVTKPTWIKRSCQCRHFEGAPAHAWIEGHLLMIGRDFKEEERTMRVNAGNVPRPTWADAFNAWRILRRQLPEFLTEPDEKVWTQQMFQCTEKFVENKGEGVEEVPKTTEVNKLRKRLKGLVVGTLDKNKGELWVACPVLYHKALKRAYTNEKDYEVIYPAKLSSYRTRRYEMNELPGEILRTVPMPKRQKGSWTDIVKLYERMYKDKGWNKLAKFDRKGGINQPYVLFKAKNMIDPEKRRTAWMKARPIAPATQHPMKRLMHYVGRAWSFVTARIPGENFVLNKVGQVDKFLEEVTTKIKGDGPLRARVYDIVGCYPHMPKETIRFALRAILDKFPQYEGVWVPTRSDTTACEWKSRRKDGQQILFSTMLEVMEFSLDFAMIRMPDGRIWRQKQGIPMGDPLSPGMAIGTCAWMEEGWMQTLTREDKQRFQARRFMDDILIIYKEDETWEHEKFMTDFTRSECYQQPLELEEGKPHTFLETRFWLYNDTIQYKLKNDNENGDNNIWRYQHWYSSHTESQKIATLTATLRKTQKASSSVHMIRSTCDKVEEFRRLRYPLNTLLRVCNRLGATTGNGGYIIARDILRSPSTVQRP